MINDQSQLFEREKILRSIVENASDMIIVVNKDATILYINRALPGFKIEGVIGKKVYDYVMPEYHDEYREAIVEVFHSEKPKKIISKAFGPYKSISWYETIITPIIEEDQVVDLIFSVRDITERKQAEEDLRDSEEKYRESEEKYRNITEQLLMGIFILQDNIFKYVNEAVSTINEFTVEEMMVWTPLEFLERIHPDDRQEIYKLSSNRQGGEKDVPKSVSCRVITKSGKIKWVEAYGISIIYQGKPADMSMVIDITEKKEAEHKIKESEEKFRNIVENSLDGITLTNERGVIIEWNQGMEEISGYKQEEVLGRPVWEVQFQLAVETARTVELKEQLRNSIIQIISMKDLDLPTQTREQEIQCRNGSRKIIHTSSYLIKIDRGIMIGSIIRDISKRKEAEQKLKEHLTKMEVLNRVIVTSNKAESTSTLLEEIFNSILEIMNLDGGGVYLINESTKSAELIYNRGLNPEFIKFVRNIQIEDKEYRNVFIEGNSILAENLPTLNANMAKISGFNSVISIPLFSKERIIGAINIGSKRRYTFSEIEKEIFNSLSREIGTAISKVQSEEALKKSEVQYREAFNRAEFYKDIFAHDINNILQSILTTTELSSLLIKNGENIDDLNNLFNDLKVQVDRGAKLVSNVRTLSKIENTAFPLIKVKVNQILNDAIKFISDSYQQDVDIFVESQQDEYLIHANELLVEVFENILINAIRHNNNTSIEISVRLSRYQENNKQNIKIEFIDNGKGVEDSRKEAIFQRGHEKGKSTSGMGLGLSLVKKILQIYKGQIWVEDRVKGNPSKGSNFVVLIPEAI